MRVVVIGATGHVGGYLVPRLVRAGHEVVAVSRGTSQPYRQDDAWAQVKTLQIDRAAAEADGTFGSQVAELDADVVIDMICFTPESAEHLVDALRGRVRQLVHVGTIWIHGTLTEVPATEDEPRRPWGEYGTQKAAIEELLLAQSHSAGLPVAIVHPGHISGPGWNIITPQGTADPAVWATLAHGEPLLLPDLGLETVHHVHADDVAGLIVACVEQPEQANGEAFYSVSPRALTLRGFAEAAAGWFGREADLRFLPLKEFLATLPDEHAEAALQHVSRSHSMSTEKSRRLLGFAPQHSSLDTVREAVGWLAAEGRLGEDLRGALAS